MYRHNSTASIIKTSLRLYSSPAKQAQDKYVARLMPKRILKASEQSPNFESSEHVEEINEAVKKYLVDYRKNSEFFEERNKEFELGKRHLANIMGYDPNEITQEQIDDAIKYLFPSGLFDVKNSTPVMKPPTEIYPNFKAAHYDKRGRPFNSFFYTGLPNYYSALYELYSCYDELNQIEDDRLSKGIQAGPEDKFNILKFNFMTKKQLEELFVEQLTDQHYERLISHLNKLIDHPLSALKSDFITKYTLAKIEQRADTELFKIKIDETGREYSESSGFFKSVECLARVYNKGSGKFLINDQYTMNFFNYYIYRERIMTPYVMADLIDKVDVYCYFEPVDQPLKIGFFSAYAGAIRYSISKAFCAFLDDEKRELLRVNGLLQHDKRIKERKKPGKLKARKSRPYRKR